MKVIKESVAGSLESSDALITVSPKKESGVEFTVESIVLKQFGRRIRAVAEEIAKAKDLSFASVNIQDRGALECTLRARLETAMDRAAAEA